MRHLDARYSGLRTLLDKYGQEYLDRAERRRIEDESGKHLPALSAPKVIGLIFVALVVGFLAGRWYEHQLMPMQKKQLQLYVKVNHG